MIARLRFLVVAGFVCLATTPSLFAQSFFLKKGDIVVVMGDSITEQRLYSNYLEIWAQTRFPSYQLVFRNVGIGGDRSVGGNARFKRDVLPYNPTVLTVDFGMNDASYTSFKEQNFKPYMKGLQGIADQARAAGIRVAWITPQPTERREPGTQLAGYNETLMKFSEGVAAIAKKNDGLFVDQFGPYLNVMNKARHSDPKMLVTGGDAVHPGPPGQALMAASILKGMSFPREVSSVTVDISGKATHSNCKVFDVDTKDGIGVKFHRLDAALPYFPEQAKSILKWAPLLEETNYYGLQVTGLPAPGYKYAVRLGGTKVAEYTGAELSAGVNLAAAALTVGPVADQVKDVIKAVNAKTTYFHDKIYRGLVLNNPANIPELKDVPAAEREKRREALVQERLRKMPELDAAIRAALRGKSHLVEVISSK
jgi:lysophospholipase L1-like esterase